PQDHAAAPQADANLAQLTRDHELMTYGLRFEHERGAVAAHMGVWTLRYKETGQGPTPTMVSNLMQSARGRMLSAAHEQNAGQVRVTVDLEAPAESPIRPSAPP